MTKSVNDIGKKPGECDTKILSIFIEKAMSYSHVDPETSLMHARKSVEAICSTIFAREIGNPKDVRLDKLIELLSKEDKLPKKIKIPLQVIQQYGNYGAHYQEEVHQIDRDYISPCLSALIQVTNWYFLDYLKSEIPSIVAKANHNFEAQAVPIQKSFPTQMSCSRKEEQTKTHEMFEPVRNRIIKVELKPVFEKIISEIKNFADDIEMYTTQKYIGFKYKGKLIGTLFPHRKLIDLSVHFIDKNDLSVDRERIRIESENDDYTEILEKIFTMYKTLRVVPKINERIEKPEKFDQLRNYIIKADLKPLFEKIILKITGFSDDIEMYSTTQYIGFTYKGKLIGSLAPHRKSFDMSAHIIDENGRFIEHERIRIESGNDDYQELLKKIFISYKNKKKSFP